MNCCWFCHEVHFKFVVGMYFEKPVDIYLPGRIWESD
jgi:hypothetical protein